MTKEYDEQQARFKAALDSLAGKQIESATWDWRSGDRRSFGVLTIKCSDGTELRLASYDFEGYSSGIELWDELDEKERQAFEEAPEE